MTVKELKNIINKLPDDMEVYEDCCMGHPTPLHYSEIINFEGENILNLF